MDQMTTPQHKNMAAGAWEQLSFTEQMANCGSEVFRALRWREKGKKAMETKAFERALELLDLTITSHIKAHHSTYELLRLREVLCDYFVGDNEYGSTPDSLNKYYDFFSQKAARLRELRM